MLRGSMASIVTRTGDAGTTGLLYNRRVPTGWATPDAKPPAAAHNLPSAATP